jgi:hypothetical protein
MPKKLLATTILTAILVLVIGIQVVEVEANPTIPYPQVPNTDLPSLTVETPANPMPLNDNNTVAINITVIQPDSWNHYYMRLKPLVGSYNGYVSIDGLGKFGDIGYQHQVSNCIISFIGYPDTVFRISGYNHSGDYNHSLSNTVQHTVIIQVYGETFSQIGNYEFNITQDVSFTINSSSQTISFLESPVRIDRGTYPTTSPSSSSTPILTAIFVTYVISGVIAGSALLIYFKRRKGKP